MNNRALVASGVVVFIVSFFTVCLSENAFAGKTPSLQFLMKVASELNKSCPMVVNKEMELGSVYAQTGSLGYNYYLLNYNANEIDVHTFLSNQAKPIRNNTCTSPRMQRFFKNGVKIIYSYHGKDRKFLTDIIVTPEDCSRL